MGFMQEKVKMNQLCNSDLDLPIRFTINVSKLIISTSEVTTVNKLKQNNTLKMTLANGSPGGEIYINNFEILEMPNFVDYLRSGWQFSLSIAIDFTASNGAARHKTSYHSFNDKNYYKQGISDVGGILEQYDQFKHFPVFGFGAVPRFMGERETNHCFPLNGNYDEPEIQGIDNVLKTYLKNLPTISMGGPTFFSSIMDVFMDFATEGRDLKTYFILLIMTDGTIHDFGLTKRLIVQASKLPCSIIIVGVGDNDFYQMYELDGDEGLLKDEDERQAVRDIVQFVRLQDCTSKMKLSEEVLKEIPDQFCQYMELINFKPFKLQADLDRINRTVNKQKSAMLER